jgi:hypothetical protein
MIIQLTVANGATAPSTKHITLEAMVNSFE